jgi:hypothetical protein
MGILSQQELAGDEREKMSGAHSAQLVHSDLAHIRLVLDRLSADVLSESGLPRAYWRKRLQRIMQNHQLSKSQSDEIAGILAALKG